MKAEKNWAPCVPPRSSPLAALAPRPHSKAQEMAPCLHQDRVRSWGDEDGVGEIRGPGKTWGPK